MSSTSTIPVLSPSLTQLSLSGKFLRVLPVDLCHLRFLLVLNLSGMGLIGYHSLFPIRTLDTLEVLILKDNEIGDAEKEEEKGFWKGFPRLHTLVLSKCGLKVFPDVSECMGLVKLSLAYNGIKEVPKEIEKNEKLVELRLASNMIEKISEMHKLVSLKTLDLGNNKLNLHMVQKLSSLPCLSNLNVKGNPNISDKDLNVIKSTFPTLIVLNYQNLKGKIGGVKKEPVSMNLTAEMIQRVVEQKKQEITKSVVKNKTDVIERLSKTSNIKSLALEIAKSFDRDEDAPEVSDSKSVCNDVKIIKPILTKRKAEKIIPFSNNRISFESDDEIAEPTQVQLEEKNLKAQKKVKKNEVEEKLKKQENQKPMQKAINAKKTNDFKKKKPQKLDVLQEIKVVEPEFGNSGGWD